MYASSSEQRSRNQVQALAEQLHRERFEYLLRIAVKHAANRDDAADSVQFAFLSFVEKYDPASGAPPLAWLTITAKRNCWAARRRRYLDRSAGQEAAPDSAGRSFAAESILSGDTGPEHLVELVDDVQTRLAALKPAERRALSLIAMGYSYAEIGELNEWTFTKVNRCITEGRAALRVARSLD